MTRRRGARRACLAAAGALVGAALLAPGPAAQEAGDPEAGRPLAWDGAAAATGVRWVASPRSQVAVFPEFVRGDLPDGESEFGASGTAVARASTFYPGAGVLGLQILACGQGLDRAPGPACTTQYPLSVEASHPSAPDARAPAAQRVGGDGAPLAMTANEAAAHADRQYVSSDARVSGVTIAGTAESAAASLAFRRQATSLLLGPAAAATVRPSQADTAALSVESVEAHTRQAFEGEALVVRARVRLDGVRLAGGTIHVDSIEAESVSKAATGEGGRVTESTVRVSGVTVAGQPATIDGNGVTITSAGSQGKPVLDALNGALDQALAAAKTDVRLVGATETADGESTHGQAAGLLYGTEVDLSAVPQAGSVYSATLLLGSAGTTAYASGAAQPGPDDGATDDLLGDLLSGTGDEAVLSGGFDDTAAADGGGAAPAAEGAPEGAPARPRPPAAAPAGLLGGVVADRVQLLYLAFALGFLALCIAPPRFWPARLPAAAGPST